MICGSQDQCLRPLSFDDIQPFRPKYLNIFKSSYCDVGSYKVEPWVKKSHLKSVDSPPGPQHGSPAYVPKAWLNFKPFYVHILSYHQNKPPDLKQNQQMKQKTRSTKNKKKETNQNYGVYSGIQTSS